MPGAYLQRSFEWRSFHSIRLTSYGPVATTLRAHKSLKPTDSGELKPRILVLVRARPRLPVGPRARQPALAPLLA